MRTFLFILALSTTASAQDLLFLDVAQGDWNCSVVNLASSTNMSAVNNYMSHLSNGSLGQAIRERYAFDGQIETNSSGIDIVSTVGVSIDELVIADMQGYLDDDDDRLSATNETLRSVLSNTDDPGHDLIQTLVAMLDTYQPGTLQRRAKYTPICKTEARAKQSHCQRVYSALAAYGTATVRDNYSGKAGTCYVRAPGTKDLTYRKLASQVGLIISDCTYVPSLSYTKYVQGHINKSDYRRKVCVQVRTTNC